MASSTGTLAEGKLFATAPTGSNIGLQVGGAGFLYGTSSASPAGVIGLDGVDMYGSSLTTGFTTVATLAAAPTVLWLASPGVMYTGDAAGAITKLTGSGLSFAVEYTTAVTFSLNGGATVTVGGFNGMSGYAPADSSSYKLVFTSSGSSANYLVSFDTVAMTAVGIARTCTNSLWAGVGLGPLPPPSQTATSSASASPTITASATAPPSTGASPSSSPSGTPSLSLTSSVTPTPLETPSFTRTPHAPCVNTAPPAGNAPPAQTSVIAFRTGGGGSSALATTGSVAVWLDEVDVATGAVLQTWALPNGQCVGALTAATAGYNQISRTFDGGAVFLPCFKTNASSAAISNANQKAVWGLYPDGSVSLASTWAATGTGNMRGVAAMSAVSGPIY